MFSLATPLLIALTASSYNSGTTVLEVWPANGGPPIYTTLPNHLTFSYGDGVPGQLVIRIQDGIFEDGYDP